VSGFSVNPEELREFAGKLDEHRTTASAIKGLVDKADVSNKSWGVVGLFVFDNYTNLLNDLRDTFKAMEEGLQSGAGKFRDTAQGYADQEAALKTILDGIQVDRG
jgi:hypothetical protein